MLCTPQLQSTCHYIVIRAIPIYPVSEDENHRTNIIATIFVLEQILRLVFRILFILILLTWSLVGEENDKTSSFIARPKP